MCHNIDLAASGNSLLSLQNMKQSNTFLKVRSLIAAFAISACQSFVEKNKLTKSFCRLQWVFCSRLSACVHRVDADGAVFGNFLEQTNDHEPAW